MGLKDDLRGVVPESRLKSLSDRFEVIGDIAILSVPDTLAEYKRTIAQAVIAKRKNIYTVLNKLAKVGGNSRTARYEIVAGTTTVTLHREFGFVYRLDVQKMFFTSRLAYERKRVIDQVSAGERLLVPFCGVGPVAIPAAAKGADVVAVEMNPEACEYLAENVRENQVQDRITVIRGDASDISLLPHRPFDRAVIPAPYGMDAILYVLSPVVRRGGMIHFTTFKKRHQIRDLAAEYEERGLGVRFCRPCGNVAPGVSRWVFDLKKQTA
jgi:tRNA (guanine37-N1)-methyltransferase